MTPESPPPVPRSATGRARRVLPLLLLPAIAWSQGNGDPSGFGYGSATESHRAFEAKPPRPDTSTSATTELDDIPSADEPESVEPDAGAASDAPGGTVAEGDSSRMGEVFLPYDSVLDDYAPYEESDGPNWIEANDTVGEIGGWRAYARELFEAADDEGDEE